MTDVLVFPITIKQGATFVLRIDFENDLNGCNFDITEWTFAGQIRDTYKAATASADFTMAVIFAESGSLQIQLPASRTNPMVPGNKFWDGEMTSGSFVHRFIEGPAQVTPQVTQ